MFFLISPINIVILCPTTVIIPYIYIYNHFYLNPELSLFRHWTVTVLFLNCCCLFFWTVTVSFFNCYCLVFELLLSYFFELLLSRFLTVTVLFFWTITVSFLNCYCLIFLNCYCLIFELLLSRYWTVTLRPLLRFLTISRVIELRFKRD